MATSRLEEVDHGVFKEVHDGYSQLPGRDGGITVIPSATGTLGAQMGQIKYPGPKEVRVSIGDPPADYTADVSLLPDDLVTQVRQTLSPLEAISELRRLQERAKMNQPLFPESARTQEEVLAATPAPASVLAGAAVASAQPASPQGQPPVVEVGIRVPGFGTVPMRWNYAAVDHSRSMVLLGKYPGQSTGFNLEDSGADASLILNGSEFVVILTSMRFPPVNGMSVVAYMLKQED